MPKPAHYRQSFAGGWTQTCLILQLFVAIVASRAFKPAAASPPAGVAQTAARNSRSGRQLRPRCCLLPETQAQDAASVLQLLAGELEEDGYSYGAAAAYPSQSAQQFTTAASASLSDAAAGSTSSSSSSVPAISAHQGNRSGSNGTYRFSHVLQFQIPQPWDTVNMSQIVKDNLEPDLQYWHLTPYEPLVDDLFNTARNDREFTVLPSVRQLVEIYNNTLRFPLMPPEQQYSCDEWCDPQLRSFTEAMHDAVALFNLSLPNVLFLINTADSPRCNQDMVANRECRAPVISLSKQAHIADLVGPVMKAEDSRVVHRYWPWELKQSKAFFRGVPSCGEMAFPPHLCARTWVARLAHTNYSHLLDAGLVERYDRADQVAGDAVLREGGPVPVLPRVHMRELPKYKWLLNLDGHVAAYRLAQLLATNSLVLKQQSFFYEFYYKSLRPYHHYVPVFKHSQHDLMPKLQWAISHEDIARRIVRHANHFALTYTTYKARILYWKYLLMGYSRLVPDMAEYFEKRAKEQQPVDMVALLKQQLAALQQQATAQPQPQQDSSQGAAQQAAAGGDDGGGGAGGDDSAGGGDSAVGDEVSAASELAALAGEDGSSGDADAADQAGAALMAQLAGSFR